MEETRFEQALQVLAGVADRRDALRSFGAAGMALLAGRGLSDTVARKRRHKKKRKKKRPPISCAEPCLPEAPATCGRTGECVAGTCALHGPQTVCRAASCVGATLHRAATCDGNGACPPSSQVNCDDGIACTADACDASSERCTHTPDDDLCPDPQICDPQQGCRCPNDRPVPCGQGCFDAGASCNTGQFGVCAEGTLQCIGNQPTCVQNVQPSAEVCDGLDNDCDGAVDFGACPAGQRCEGSECCKVDGFAAEHVCTSGTECCSGHCYTHFTGTKTCRPADCLPTGGDCTSSNLVCCSWTCSANRCQ